MFLVKHIPPITSGTLALIMKFSVEDPATHPRAANGYVTKDAKAGVSNLLTKVQEVLQGLGIA